MHDCLIALLFGDYASRNWGGSIYLHSAPSIQILIQTAAVDYEVSNTFLCLTMVIRSYCYNSNLLRGLELYFVPCLLYTLNLKNRSDSISLGKKRLKFYKFTTERGNHVRTLTLGGVEKGSKSR